jgi:hypothetical protein
MEKAGNHFVTPDLLRWPNEAMIEEKHVFFKAIT